MGALPEGGIEGEPEFGHVLRSHPSFLLVLPVINLKEPCCMFADFWALARGFCNVVASWLRIEPRGSLDCAKHCCTVSYFCGVFVRPAFSRRAQLAHWLVVKLGGLEEVHPCSRAESDSIFG